MRTRFLFVTSAYENWHPKILEHWPMTSPGKIVFFADCAFHINENVYEPAEDSFLFAENLKVKEEDTIIDVGTGCGVLGIIAAKTATRVICVDINPHAVQCATENARLNHVLDKLFFIQGDLFAPIRRKERSDLILFNAPYLPSETDGNRSWLDCAWAGGVGGRQVIDRFVNQVGSYLKPDGRVFLMQSTLSDVDKTLYRLQGNGLNGKIVASRDLPFFETLVLIRAEH